MWYLAFPYLRTFPPVWLIFGFLLFLLLFWWSTVRNWVDSVVLSLNLSLKGLHCRPPSRPLELLCLHFWCIVDFFAVISYFPWCLWLLLFHALVLAIAFIDYRLVCSLLHSLPVPSVFSVTFTCESVPCYFPSNFGDLLPLEFCIQSNFPCLVLCDLFQLCSHMFPLLLLPRVCVYCLSLPMSCVVYSLMRICFTFAWSFLVFGLFAQLLLLWVFLCFADELGIKAALSFRLSHSHLDTKWHFFAFYGSKAKERQIWQNPPCSYVPETIRGGVSAQWSFREYSLKCH